jgi:hypothetical protein
VRLLFTMDPIVNFFSLNVGMSASLAGLPVIIKAEKLDIIFLQMNTEMDTIIKECENNKAPGLDGLSYELYK